jgi:signal transduction histidine kinase
MWVNDRFFENLPFPYFLIEKNSGVIVEKSLLAEAEFPNKPSIQELIESSYLSLVDKVDIETYRIGMEVPLLTLTNQYTYYRFYPYKESEHHYHLFLIPISSPKMEIERIIDKITTKFSSFQQEIKDNKQYIDQTVMQIHKASVTNRHYQNIDKLAAGIAHEIRNPLTTVSGFIQLLKPYLIEIGKEQYANIALEELYRANQIINEFLNESKPPEHHKKMISLNQLVKDTRLLYESEAILKNITIINQFAHEDIEFVANDNQLKQVLVNLLKNAIEAIELRQGKVQGGIIHYYTVLEDNKAYVVIKDDGCGMDEKTLQNLFLPFHTTKETGTGVGLSVCKKIIEEHEGTITVESTEGIGTTFRIEFPFR